MRIVLILVLTITFSMTSTAELQTIALKPLSVEELNAEVSELEAMEAQLNLLLDTTLSRENMVLARHMIPRAVSGDAQATEQLVTAAFEMGQFQELYDSYSLRAVSYIMDLSYLALEGALLNLEPQMKLSKKHEQKLIALKATLRGKYQQYLDNKTLDTPWSDPKAKLNSACKAYFRALSQLDLFVERRTKKQMFTGLRRSFITAPDVSIKQTVFSVIPAVKFVWRVLFPEPKSTEVRRGRLSLPSNLKAVSQSLTKAFGFKVTIENEHRLKKALSDRKVITLITPNHTHMYADMMALSEVIQQDSILVSAIGALPVVKTSKGLRKKAYGHPQFVGVGSHDEKSLSPLDKTIEILRRETSNNVVIYPQGSLNAGLLEVRPTSKRFGSGYVKGLIDAGFEVQILPVVYDNSGTPLMDDLAMLAKRNKRVLNVDVKSPITSGEVKFLLEYDPTGALFNQVLRQHWLSNLETSDESIVGQLRLKSAVNELNFLAPVLMKHSNISSGSCAAITVKGK